MGAGGGGDSISKASRSVLNVKPIYDHSLLGFQSMTEGTGLVQAEANLELCQRKSSHSIERLDWESGLCLLSPTLDFLLMEHWETEATVETVCLIA